MLLPLGGFVLNVIPTEGRGTFHLWNFDPTSESAQVGSAAAAPTRRKALSTQSISGTS